MNASAHTASCLRHRSHVAANALLAENSNTLPTILMKNQRYFALSKWAMSHGIFRQCKRNAELLVSIVSAPAHGSISNPNICPIPQLRNEFLRRPDPIKSILIEFPAIALDSCAFSVLEYHSDLRQFSRPPQLRFTERLRAKKCRRWQKKKKSINYRIRLNGPPFRFRFTAIAHNHNDMQRRINDPKPSKRKKNWEKKEKIADLHWFGCK